jgi:hypothetical protein
MVRTGLIALVVAASLAPACKGKGKDGGEKAKPADTAEAPAPPPRVPEGKVPVTLPTAGADGSRRVASADAVVTVAKDGTIKQGKLAAGPDPYGTGAAHAADKQLQEELFGTKPPVQDDPPPPPPDDQDDPPPPEPDDVDDDRAQGQYKMKKPVDDPQLARQQAIEAARQSGILGSTALTGTGVSYEYGNLLGPPTAAYGELDTGPGKVDALVLADSEATVGSVVTSLKQLDQHKATLGVDGVAAPDAVKFSFTTEPEVPPDMAGAISALDASTIAVSTSASKDVTVIQRDPSGFDRTKIAAALRPSPMTPVAGLVVVQLQPDMKMQDLVDLLGVLAQVGAPRIRIDASGLSGGFGGGLGQGWGTIGTGNYGTIGGNGAGYGVGGGRGGMRGSSANVPQVRIGNPSAVGDLDKAIIRRYIKRNIQKITYCYEKQLLAKPGIKGTVSTQFFIMPSGHVDTATATGVDPDVSECLVNVIKAIEFPKPKGGGGVQVNYPFTFRPTGG